MRKCCGYCFGDAFLTKQINLISAEKGTCEFCHTTDVDLVDPSLLLDRFEIILGVYRESDESNSCSLEQLLRNDWGLFEKLDSVAAEMLLGLVFDNLSIVKKKFLPVIEKDSNAILEWEKFRDELKHSNRFFPQNAPATNHLRELFDFFVGTPQDVPKKVFRARICETPKSFTIKEMGKPPSSIISNGRANPAGISCLYVASDASTAIAEIRPHKGEKVCVAEFQVDEHTKMVDLRSPRKTVSLFDLFEEQIRLLIRYMAYVYRLSEELTLPVTPKTAHLEYLPSQYLCEFMKYCNYDGVIYRSAMGSGFNCALFNDDKVKGIDVKTYFIDNITVSYSEDLVIPS